MIFRSTTIRLTILFTVVQLLLFAVFAIAVYAYVTGAFDFDAAESDGEGAVNAAEQGFANLRVGLLIAYAALLVFVPSTSYAMARFALRPLKLSYELQQRFVDGASHEMRTPLAVIQGELELALSRERSPREYRSAIATALDAASGLARLTGDLLLLSRDEKGQLGLTFQRVRLHDVARDAVARRHHNPGPRVLLGRASSAVVLGSEELLARAIDNLIDNAVKFTGDGSSITVEVVVVDGRAVVSVTDTGIGMTRDETSRAFDRFWRADAARSRPGHGLGLPLVRQIAGAHRGRVSIDSLPGARTTVEISLPLAV